MDVNQSHNPSFSDRPYPAVSDTLPPRQTRSMMPLLLVILATLVAAAVLPSYLENIQYRRVRGEIAAINEQMPGLQPASLGKIFTFLARKVSHSAVHIETEREVDYRGRDELAALYGPRMRQQQQGQASGVIVDESGYIVTNYHVIANADVVRVRLTTGKTYVADVIGSDPKNDLAVLKIEPNDLLIPAPWGDSNALEVGEMVWALGNPFGLDFSLTFGIVSAKDRRGVNAESRYQEYLQTDAAVNPGNSGGPLVNVIGEIVGINTAIVGPTYQGISFAIPSNVARRIYEQIRKNGEVINGFLGVLPATITDELAIKLKLKSTEGALVREVVPDSPAAQAGIVPGDVILEWRGQKLEDAQALPHYVARTDVGNKVKVTIVRDGETKTVEVIVGRRPKEHATR